MAQLLVRQLDQDLKDALQRRARSHGRSTEEEVREILRDAVRSEQPAPVQLGSKIASRFRGEGTDQDFPELRGHLARAAELPEP